MVTANVNKNNSDTYISKHSAAATVRREEAPKEDNKFKEKLLAYRHAWGNKGGVQKTQPAFTQSILMSSHLENKYRKEES